MPRCFAASTASRAMPWRPEGEDFFTARRGRKHVAELLLERMHAQFRLDLQRLGDSVTEIANDHVAHVGLPRMLSCYHI